jgi:hypothetical protein
MGSEVKCWVRSGKQESEGKALLETSEIIFRGDFRLKLRSRRFCLPKLWAMTCRCKPPKEWRYLN